MGSLKDKFITNTADVGTSTALAILATATAPPLALLLAGASLVSLITAWSLQGTKDAAAEEAEAQRQFEILVQESGSVRLALERIAQGQLGTNLFIADKAREVLDFLAELQQDQAKAMREHEELAVYIGSKIESYLKEMGAVSEARHTELVEAAGRLENLLNALLDARTLRLGEIDRYEAVYRDWLTKTTAKLLVPGLGVELSITDSSAKLFVMASSKEKSPTPTTTVTLAAELKRYREWAAQDERSDGEAIDAIHLREFSEEIVVIGGPGSGKSTLARRIAHTATAECLVLLARLKNVAKLLPTVGFADALATVAFENSGVPVGARHQLLEKATCIILDGLDETGGHRLSVAEHIRAWRQGHKSCQVIVMTRPVGHDASLLAGWKHVELKKMSADEARAAAKRMVTAIAPNDFQRIAAVDDALGSAISSNAAVSLAARNPLLLGFVVHRLTEGGTLPSRRVDLFDLVIKRLATIPNDRDVPAADSMVVLRRSLDAAGWIILSDPDATKDVVINGIAQQYNSSSQSASLDSISRAEKDIEIWEERRVMETLTLSYERAISFVHPALGEYAAACHAARLRSSEYSTWVTKCRLQPHWREVLLMSAAIRKCEECIRTLLSLDKPDNPAAIEHVLAAACIVENQGASSQAIEQVLRHLARRLSSTSRLVCREAADAIWSLVPFAQSKIGPVVKDIQDHEQLWTRRLALALTAVCEPNTVRIDLAEEHLQWFIFGCDSDAKRDLFNTHDHALRARALEAILPLAASTGNQKMVQTVVEAWENGKMSISMSKCVLRLLISIGAVAENAEPAYQKRMSKRHEDLWIYDYLRDEAKAILATIVAASVKLGADVSVASSQPQPPVMNLARVIAAWKLWDRTLPEICGVKADAPCAVAMIAATIAATRCDPKLVAAEATALLEADDDAFSALTSDKVPKLPVTTDWSKAPEWTMAADFLVEAVTHDSLILSWPAANLIVDRLGDPSLRESIFRKAMDKCDSESAMGFLAIVLRELGDGFALDLALTRLKRELDPATPPLILLFKMVPVASREAEVTHVLERALHSDVRNAVAAAKVLAAIPALDLPINVMKDALTYWASAETPMPKMGVVPPSPRASLVSAISLRNGWTLDELTKFMHDQRSDVQDAYVAACVEFARHSESSLKELMSSIQQGQTSHRVLDELRLKDPGLILGVIAEVEECLQNNDKNVRLASLRLLTSLGELAPKAGSFATNALQDTDVSIRDEAIRVLRRLQEA